jgi:aerobic-type carbon monoxide dehydrogenase small subunit (CoxS/CutS family)
MMASGRAVTTIEGLATQDGDLHPMERAFIDCDAFQCGFDSARAVPGVLDILTYQNANVVKPLNTFSEGGQAASSIVPLSSPKIWRDGQIVALVVAETFEAASEAAQKIDIQYDVETPSATFGSKERR